MDTTSSQKLKPVIELHKDKDGNLMKNNKQKPGSFCRKCRTLIDIKGSCPKCNRPKIPKAPPKKSNNPKADPFVKLVSK